MIFADVGNINLIVHHTKYFSPQNKNVLLSFIETHTNTCRIITKKRCKTKSHMGCISEKIESYNITNVKCRTTRKMIMLQPAIPRSQYFLIDTKNYTDNVVPFL